jgi:hypothetical protein
MRHGLDAAHEFLVLALGVVDQGHGGLGDGGQVGVSPGWFMPSSSTASGVRAQAQHGQRQADVVVQVAPWPDDRPRPRPRKMAAIISLTVVLPLLPVTATAAA